MHVAVYSVINQICDSISENTVGFQNKYTYELNHSSYPA